MNPTLVVTLCALYFFVPSEAFVRCGVGLWKNTECKRISECDEVSSIIKQLQSRSFVEHYKFLVGPLQRRTCGLEKLEPKVCCPITRTVVNQKCGTYITDKMPHSDGSPTDPDHFPWLVLLEYQNQSESVIGCGGALISDRYVLTAAHCLDPILNIAAVRLGAYNLNDATEETIVVGIEKVIIHENYSPFRGPADFDSKLYDIALLRLDRPVTSIEPICLPNDSAFNRNWFMSAGWGAMSERYAIRSEVKRMTKLKKVDKETCNEQYSSLIFNMKDDLVCGKSKIGRMSCVADSGGPLMTVGDKANIVVVGVYAPVYDDACRDTVLPNSYIDVSQYLDWIKAHMSA